VQAPEAIGSQRPESGGGWPAGGPVPAIEVDRGWPSGGEPGHVAGSSGYPPAARCSRAAWAQAVCQRTMTLTMMPRLWSWFSWPAW
jgi:hypothetical protein